MTAVDPTYPLYPISCFIAAAILLLVSLTSLIRQSWNLGVAFLCFWFFLSNITYGINTIVWVDNADIKLYVYCDIVTRLQWIAPIIAPMATLIMVRRLYLITNLRRSVEYQFVGEKLRDLVIEWTLGLLIPLLVAGPIYYVVQRHRFEVHEGFGCISATDDSLLAYVLLTVWTVLPPLFSVTIYYPKTVIILFRQRRDINRFLSTHGNNLVSRTNYIRLLAVASVDLVITLPVTIVNIILFVTAMLSPGSVPLYRGWSSDHTDWEPVGLSYAQWIDIGGSLTIPQSYFTAWSYPITAFIIFGFYGITSEARVLYWHAFSTVMGWFGYMVRPHAVHRARSPLENTESGQPMDLEIRTRSGHVDEHRHTVQDIDRPGEGGLEAAESRP